MDSLICALRLVIGICALSGMGCTTYEIYAKGSDLNLGSKRQTDDNANHVFI